MQTSLAGAFVADLFERLDRAAAERERHYPGPPAGRQPVHVFYGGAQLFRSGVAAKLGALALRSLDEFAPTEAAFGRAFGLENASLAGAVRERVAAKLAREAIEDYRIDFEDGYGTRPA